MTTETLEALATRSAEGDRDALDAFVRGIQDDVYRKRLSRARRRMREFMKRSCGLVSEEVACRCRRQIRPSVQAGLLDPERPVYTVHPTWARQEPGLREAYEAIESGERYLRVLRSHPEYAAPDSVRQGLRRVLG